MNSEPSLEAMRKIPDPLGEEFAARRRHELAPLPPSFPPSKSRGEVRALRWGALAAVLIAEAIAVVVLKPRVWSEGLVAFGALVPLVGSLVGLLGAERLAPRRVATRTLLAIVLPSLLFLVSSWLSRNLVPKAVEELIHPTLVCFAIATGLSVAPLVALAVAYRNAFASASVARGVALGLASGCVGAVALRLHCPEDAFFHLIVGHGSALLVGALVGAILGRRILRG